jgi:HEPN domain-containing protein
MTKDQLFKREYAKKLLNIAKGDLETTEVLLAAKKGRPENICFYAQQVIEKSLKALLCHKGLPIPFTHSIELILDRLGKDSQPPHGSDLIVLTDFATIRRYEEGNEIIDQDDLNASVEAARQTLDWAESQITD